MTQVEITYFSDVLCIWAYVSQARIEAVEKKYGEAFRIEYRFCSVFGDTDRKITSTWKDRGGTTRSIHICERWRSPFRISRSPPRNLAKDTPGNIGKCTSVHEICPAINAWSGREK